MPIEEAMGIVKSIMKNAKLDPVTKSPTFAYQSMSMLDDVSVQMKNIAKNIEGGKFKADKDGGLIKTESDLNLLGNYSALIKMLTRLSPIPCQTLQQLARRTPCTITLNNNLQKWLNVENEV